MTRFIVHIRDEKERRQWAETERLLKKDALPIIGKLPIEAVTPKDVRDILARPEAQGREVRVGVNRLLSALNALFRWAVNDGLIVVSPSAGISARHKERKRDRVLTDPEISDIWQGAQKVGGAYGAVVQMLILTGQRRGEVAAMAREELSVDGLTWRVPAARSKNGKPHDVPLSVPARNIIATRPKGHERLFSGDGKISINGWSKPKRELDIALKEAQEKAAAGQGGGKPKAMSPWVLHDIRRTVASGMARLGVPLHVIEKILNHTSGSFGGVVGVYQRHEFMKERREALDAWGTHMIGLVTPKKRGKVPSGRRRAKGQKWGRESRS